MARMMSLQNTIEYLSEKLTMNQIASLLGVTSNMVYKYKTGYTKTCSDKIIDTIYDNFRIGDEPILVDVFNSEQEYLNFRQLREKACNQDNTK